MKLKKQSWNQQTRIKQSVVLEMPVVSLLDLIFFLICCLFPLFSNSFLTTTHPFRPIAVSSHLSVEGWTESYVDCFISEAKVELAFL